MCNIHFQESKRRKYWCSSHRKSLSCKLWVRSNNLGWTWWSHAQRMERMPKNVSNLKLLIKPTHCNNNLLFKTLSVLIVYIARAVLICSLQYTSKKFEWKQWFGQFGKGHNWQVQTDSSHKTTRGGTVAVLSTEQKRDRASQWYGHSYHASIFQQKCCFGVFYLVFDTLYVICTPTCTINKKLILVILVIW